jgi:hypothetical protein
MISATSFSLSSTGFQLVQKVSVCDIESFKAYLMSSFVFVSSTASGLLSLLLSTSFFLDAFAFALGFLTRVGGLDAVAGALVLQGLLAGSLG